MGSTAVPGLARPEERTAGPLVRSVVGCGPSADGGNPGLATRLLPVELADPGTRGGEPQNGASSPAYAEVAAVPSATVAVRFGEEPVDSVRWADVLANGAVETERVRVEIVEDGRNWVETRVVDDATGAPVPCRIHFR